MMSKPQFDRKKENKSLITGFSWTFAFSLTNNGFGLLVQLLLAKLLAPEQFGLIGMTAVFLGAFNIINEAGISSAIIQRKEDRISEVHYHTAYWTSIIMGVTLYIILFVAIAPFASWFYNEPQLYSILLVMGIALVLQPFSIIHKSIKIKKMDFKSVSIIEGIAVLVSGTTGILLAISGLGVWSIVFQGLINVTILIPLFTYSSSYKPKFQFTRKAFIDIFQFGFYVMVQKVTVHIMKNMDNLLIGKLLGAQLLGVYTVAFMLTDLIRSKLVSILDKVLFPFYSRLQDDIGYLRTYYLMAIKYNTLIVFPLMFILMLYAKPFILILFGKEWGQAIIPIMLLAFSSIIFTIGGTSGTILKSIGKPRLHFKVYLLKSLLFTIPFILIGAYFWGINGVAGAVVVHILLARVIFQHYMKKFIKATERDVFESILPALLGCVGIFIISFILQIVLNVNSIYILVLHSLVCGIVYCIVVYVQIKDELKYLLALVKS